MAAVRLPDPWAGCALWRIDLRAPVTPAELDTLDAQEKARAARFVFERDRHRHAAAHVALRRLLGQAAGLPAAGVRFGHNAWGKPLFDNAPACHFSLSHSDDVGVLAIDHVAPVGVDVEVLRPMGELDALAQAHCTPDECAALAARPSGDARLRSFLAAWTRKEACLKAIGTGLTVDTRTVATGAELAARTVRFSHPVHGRRTLRLASWALDAQALLSLARIEPERRAPAPLVQAPAHEESCA